MHGGSGHVFTYGSLDPGFIHSNGCGDARGRGRLRGRVKDGIAPSGGGSAAHRLVVVLAKVRIRIAVFLELNRLACVVPGEGEIEDEGEGE